jgi:hypothetical protein
MITRILRKIENNVNNTSIHESIPVLFVSLFCGSFICKPSVEVLFVSLFCVSCEYLTSVSVFSVVRVAQSLFVCVVFC